MYQALYRQYRPMTFEEVLGQEHITETLINQIRDKSVGHAYLFSGTRGTGKTSTAKIFSRAVNCLNPQDSSPCNSCENCLGILDGTIMDVVEMDAASNRGVNDIRELRDKVVYPPSYGKYKVYIIDEVHMLTQEAFNALLKTLEEPPKHLIFILATTEPERIPQTILSRCQRFDFKRIKTQIIVDNMKSIIERQGFSVEEEALRVIAINSDGGMRDALSLLDQCISFSQGDISYEDAIAILGIVNRDIVFKLVDDIINKSIEGVLSSIDKLFEDGRDVNQFIKDIINHFRDLMIVKSSHKARELLETSEEEYLRYKDQASKLELNYILEILKILTEVDEKSRLATDPKILLEMAMIKLIKIPNLSLEERLVRLEEKIKKIQIKPEDLPKNSLNKEVGIEESKSFKATNKADFKREKTRKPEGALKSKPVKSELKLGDNEAYKKILDGWEGLIDRIKSKRPNIAALIIEGEVESFENKLLTIKYKEGYGFHKSAIERPENKEYLKGEIARFLGGDLELKFTLEEDKPLEEVKEIAEDDIQEVEEFFGKENIEIKK